MSENKSQSYLHGAAILTASMIIIKVLGAIYKIPLYNILGTEGTAIFTAAYNIYNVLLTLSTAGLPVALSRLIAEANALGRPMQVKRVFHVGLWAFIVLGAAGSLVMYLFPTELAAFTGNVEASQSILALSPSVILVCLMSAYRGYAQGHSNMTPTSVSQVLEVAVKVAVGLLLAWFLLGSGKSLPIVSAGAIIGVPIGTAVACAYIIFNKRKFDKLSFRPLKSPDVPEKSTKILANLIKIGIPIALGSSVLSIIALIDTKIVYERLQFAVGLSYEEVKHLAGIYSEAMTLYNMPGAFITSLTISVVPAIAACVALRDRQKAKDISESSLRIATILSLPMGIGLSVLSRPIMQVLYVSNTDEGPILLAIMGITSYFMCMALMTTAILQAYGSERMPVISMIIGGIVKSAANWVLIAIPSINIYGAPLGTLICYIVMCAINYMFIYKKLQTRLRISKFFVKPFISSAVMGTAAFIVFFALSGVLGDDRLRMAVGMAAAAGTGVIVYLIMIIKTKSITGEDMNLIPKGDKLARLLKIK